MLHKLRSLQVWLGRWWLFHLIVADTSAVRGFRGRVTQKQTVTQWILVSEQDQVVVCLTYLAADVPLNKSLKSVCVEEFKSQCKGVKCFSYNGWMPFHSVRNPTAMWSSSAAVWQCHERNVSGEKSHICLWKGSWCKKHVKTHNGICQDSLFNKCCDLWWWRAAMPLSVKRHENCVTLHWICSLLIQEQHGLSLDYRHLLLWSWFYC